MGGYEESLYAIKHKDSSENYDKSTDSLESLSDAISGVGSDSTIRHIPKFGGELWYVDGVNGDNNNDGKSPATAFATITKGITDASAGDAITVMAATYTEDVDINKDSLELWAEIGVIITGQSTDYALTVSGNYCKVWCPGGAIRVNPRATKTGVLLSGSWNNVHDTRVPADSSANLGFDITGHGAVLTNCRAGKTLVAGFKVQANGVHINEGITRGLAADTSIGYWVTNSCEGVLLRDCVSRGNATAGYQIDAGVTDGEAINCSSGGGDGVKIDSDHAFVWSNFNYDEEVRKDITFSGAPTTYNIFKITGYVRISDIYGIVETQIANTTSEIHLEIYSTNGTTDLTEDTGAPDIDSLAVNSILTRKGDSGDVLGMASSAAPVLFEFGKKTPDVTFDVNADTGATTYLRLNLTAALASGKIHWHCHYEPLSDGAFVEAA